MFGGLHVGVCHHQPPSGLGSCHPHGQLLVWAGWWHPLPDAQWEFLLQFSWVYQLCPLGGWVPLWGGRNRRGGQKHKCPTPPNIHCHVVDSSAQPAITPTHGHTARAHRRQGGHACCDESAKPERTEPVIAPILESQKESDQVCEPASLYRHGTLGVWGYGEGPHLLSRCWGWVLDFV